MSDKNEIKKAPNRAPLVNMIDDDFALGAQMRSVIMRLLYL